MVRGLGLVSWFRNILLKRCSSNYYCFKEMSNKHLNIKVSERQSGEGSILEEDKLSFLMCQPKNNYFQSDKKQCKLDWARGLFYSTAGTLPLSSAPEIITHRYLFFVSTPGCVWYKSSYFVILSWNSINNSTLKWYNYLFAIFGVGFFSLSFVISTVVRTNRLGQIGSPSHPVNLFYFFVKQNKE